jgi:hypothetical protein
VALHVSQTAPKTAFLMAPEPIWLGEL